jgi:lysosomal Pro-X carboxypeptidase
MDSLRYSLQLLSLIFLFFSIWASARQRVIPRLGVRRRTSEHEVPQTTSSSFDVKIYYYTQTIDHFNFRPDSYATFQQRYAINSKYWGGADSNAPIFAYLGAEAPLDYDLGGIGFLNDNALQFNALQLYIEVKVKYIVLIVI